MGIEEDMAALISKQIAEEVDWECLSKLLCMTGWTEIRIKDLINPEKVVELGHWVKKNCEGKVRNRYGHYVFELEKDAVFFALKWS